MPALSAVLALCALVFPATTTPIATAPRASTPVFYTVHEGPGDLRQYVTQAAFPGICFPFPNLPHCKDHRPR